MDSGIDRVLKHYAKADFVTQMKARFLMFLCVAILFILPVVLLYTAYIQQDTPNYDQFLSLNILIPEIVCAAFMVILIMVLRRGYFAISAHLVLLTALACAWTVMILDRAVTLARLDTIVYILGLLCMTPLVVSRRKAAFLLYVPLNLILFWVFVLAIRGRLPDPDYAVNDYLADITIAFVFIGIVAYNVFAINRRALDRAEQDIAGLKRAEETIQLQKAELLEMNQELSITVAKMEESTREYEETNVRLMETQQSLVMSNERLRESEEKFSKAFHFSPLFVSLSILEDDRYVDVSASFAQSAGYSREEMIGHTSRELNLWANPEDFHRIRSLLHTHGFVHDEEIDFRSRSGVVYTTSYSAEVTQIFETPHLISLAIDITDRKRAVEERTRLENQLRQAQKMESIGRLAGGVAHDFNNLLSIILGYAEMALEDPSVKAMSSHNHLLQIQKAGERAQNLTRQLLAFGRKQVLNREAADLNQIIMGFRPMLARLIGEDIEIVTDLAAHPWMVHVDISQIEQILLNLAVNARDAMPYGGRLILATANVTTGEGIPGHTRSTGTEYILLKVSDTGYGMDSLTLRQIYEPFFTTKEKGQGTGLGLATVYGIVKQHGGEIFSESEQGQGAAFWIYLPRFTAQEMQPETQDEADHTAERGHATILVVEDEPDVRRLTCTILAGHGYTVLEAQHARDAIQLGFAHRGKIDLLLSDVVMPEMHGPEVADKLLALCPHIQVLYMSGYTEEELQPYGVLMEGIAFVQKPVTAQMLLPKIRAVLQGAGVTHIRDTA